VKLYSVLFNGTDYDLYCASGTKIGGFYVSVLSLANSPEQAFQLAHDKLVSSDAYLALLHDPRTQSGVLTVSDYTELSQFNQNGPEISGFVFYPEEATAVKESLHNPR
jgi:hypothetical protein